MQIVEQENTIQTLTENENSNEEMSYSEAVSHLLGELIPGRGRIVTCLFITVCFLFLTLVLWGSFGWFFYLQAPLGAPPTANQITAQKIRLIHRLPDGTVSDAIPEWIHEDLKEELFETLSLNKSSLSIYDDRQIDFVQNALKEIYWIQNVKSIRKFYPAFLEIEVVYRKPALLVAVPWQEESTDGETESRFCYIPVSSDCRILPMEAENFPVPLESLESFPAFCGEAPDSFYTSNQLIDITEFNGYEPPISMNPGNDWKYDQCIHDAVQIVNLLGNRWNTLGISYICLERKNTNEYMNELFFCLVTRNGSRIHWGKCSEKRSGKNEILDSEKLLQLDEMFQKNQKLDSPEQSFDITFRKRSVFERHNQSDSQKTSPETSQETSPALTESQSMNSPM